MLIGGRYVRSVNCPVAKQRHDNYLEEVMEEVGIGILPFIKD